MLANEALQDVAIRAQVAWHGMPAERRREALDVIGLVEILFLPNGSEEQDIWLLPRSVASRLIVDHGCREEAQRRGHDFDAPVELATEQALALQEFRATLEAALHAVDDWAGFIAASRRKAGSAR